ncbi:MAG TPA: DUF1007 family protein [Alphaproteobacteria bacterium]|nr:DUF1007 family protein [Alphaproteobacteria bacterium]
MRHGGILLVLALAWPVTASAHPHVFVDYQVAVNGPPGAIASLHFRWRYDAMYSSLVFHDYGLSAPGAAGAEKSEKIKHLDADNLTQRRFYINIDVDGKRLDVKDVGGFKASHEGENLIYDFDVPLPAPAREISFLVEDPTFYTSFAHQKENPVVVNADKIYCFFHDKGRASIWGIMFVPHVACGMEGVITEKREEELRKNQPPRL